MDTQRKIELVVRENWPHLIIKFGDYADAPGAAAHEQINELLQEVRGGKATPTQRMRFCRLVGDPTREFGDVWLEDYRCRLSLIDQTDCSGVAVFEIVGHTWDGVLECCLAARRCANGVDA